MQCPAGTTIHHQKTSSIPQKVTLFGNQVIADVSSEDGGPSTHKTGILIRKVEFGHRHTGSCPCEDLGKGLESCCHKEYVGLPETGRSKEGSSP